MLPAGLWMQYFLLLALFRTFVSFSIYMHINILSFKEPLLRDSNYYATGKVNYYCVGQGRAPRIIQR